MEAPKLGSNGFWSAILVAVVIGIGSAIYWIAKAIVWAINHIKISK